MNPKRFLDNLSILEVVFNSFHTAIAIMDKDFNFIKVNKLYAKVDHRSITDFPGRNHFELYPNDEVKGIFENVLRTQKTFQAYGYPFVYPKNPERGLTYWDFTLTPITNKRGNVEILILSLADVTERKETEIKLRESKEKFHCFFDNTFDGMLIVTPEGSIVAANPSLCKMIGMTEAEICQRGRDALVDGTDLRLYQLLMERSQTGQCKGELNFIHKNGSKIPVEITSQAYQISSGKKYAATIVKDISARINLQQEMARLEGLNLAGQMAAGMGHEVRNPLTVVRGFLQLLSSKERYCEDQGYFTVMISELDRANAIITDFLSVARCASSELALENLNEIVNDLYPLLQAGTYNAQHDIVFTPMPVPDLYLNKKEVQQLLLNLVRNAIEAMLQRGKVTITTFTDGGEVVLAIKDEGTGIDQTIINKLGTPFFTTKAQGTGMGLTTCYNIAKRNNGRIEVETGPGGTTFYVRFVRSE